MSIIKHKNQRVAVFIDTQNLYHSAKNLYGGLRVNFKNVLEEAVAGRELVRALAYVITTEAGDENIFFEALTKMGIETKTKDLQIFFGGHKKADWDIGMAVDAIKIVHKVDVIILITGDGDFIPLVEYLKNSVQVEVISFGKSSSTNLRNICDDFIDLGEEPEKYLIGFRKTRTGIRTTGVRSVVARTTGVRPKGYFKNNFKPAENISNITKNIPTEKAPLLGE